MEEIEPTEDDYIFIEWGEEDPSNGTQGALALCLLCQHFEWINWLDMIRYACSCRKEK